MTPEPAAHEETANDSDASLGDRIERDHGGQHDCEHDEGCAALTCAVSPCEHDCGAPCDDSRSDGDDRNGGGSDGIRSRDPVSAFEPVPAPRCV